MKSKSKSKQATFTLPSRRKTKVKGVQTLNGTQYVHIKYGQNSAYVPYAMFVGEKAEARNILKQQGVLVIQDRDWSAIIEAVDQIPKFKKRPLIEKSGWTSPYFAFRDGTVVGPPNAPEAIAIFPKVETSSCNLGSLAEWKTKIAIPIVGQHLLMVAVLASFASALVTFSGEKQNFGLELSGPPEMGKTTWLLLFASVAGRPTDIPTFHATRTGQEDMFGEFRDMPFPVDEANLADPSDKQFVKDFAFRFANGVPKISRNQPDRAQYRFVFATTANEPIREALGKMNGDTSGAALQRLMPLRIDVDRPEGVFSYVPENFASPGAFATYLNDTIEVHYGTPMQAFLQALVAQRAIDPEKFVTKIRQRIAAFETRAGVASATRGKTRATSAFGLLYAAGSFAKAKAILPETWDCMAACLAAYRNYQACLPDQTPLQTRLLTIAQRSDTLDLRDGSVPTLSDKRMAIHGAFIKFGKSKRVELLLTEGIKRKFFEDWSQLKLTKDFRDLNLSAKDHHGQQRQVRLGKKKERFVCFVLLPELVEQLDGSG